MTVVNTDDPVALFSNLKINKIYENIELYKVHYSKN